MWSTCSQLAYGRIGCVGNSRLVHIECRLVEDSSSMPAAVAAQLEALGFSTDDYQSILSLDPFANGSTIIDSQRFAPTTYSFPYEPPSQSQNCNNGICTCISVSENLKNEFQGQAQQDYKTGYKVGIKESSAEYLFPFLAWESPPAKILHGRVRRPKPPLRILANPRQQRYFALR